MKKDFTFWLAMRGHDTNPSAIWRTLCCAALLLCATALRASPVDYIITTTGNAIVITDNSGNGETLTVSENGGNIRFVAPATRTYIINGVTFANFSTPADVALTGVTSITINTAGGNDIIEIGAFSANLPTLTINGGTGNDEVNFNGNITFAPKGVTPL